MRERGYPVDEDFEQRAADISVDHPSLVENYRAANEISLDARNGQASTEQLRQPRFGPDDSEGMSMERSEKTLSTRDLAQPNESADDDSVAPQRATAPDGAAGSAGDATPLLSGEASSSFQRRWDEVQTHFVDEPRAAVESADELVANLMHELAEGFAGERERLETQWDRGADISTEDLRVALQRYRSFFHRLLAA